MDDSIVDNVSEVLFAELRFIASGTGVSRATASGDGSV
jgi:hypothetical protein